jgi:hypothetical protein
MTIIDGFIAALKANSPLHALTGDQIYSMYAPAAATSVWLVITRISNIRVTAHDGDGAVGRIRYQVDIGGANKTLVDQVRDLLVGMNGTQYQTGIDLTMLVADDRETWDEPTRTFKSSVDFFVWSNQ